MQSREFARTTGQRVVSADAVAFMQRVYGWMTAGLAVTGFVAFYIASSPAAINLIFASSYGFILVVVAQLGLVFVVHPASGPSCGPKDPAWGRCFSSPTAPRSG